MKKAVGGVVTGENFAFVQSLHVSYCSRSPMRDLSDYFSSLFEPPHFPSHSLSYCGILQASCLPHTRADRQTDRPGRTISDPALVPYRRPGDWMNKLCHPIWWAVLLDLITVVNEGARESPPVCSAAAVTLRHRKPPSPSPELEPPPPLLPSVLPANRRRAF